MALHNMAFTFPGGDAGSIKKQFSHTGVVGSGDLEILFTQTDLGGGVEVNVTTPVRGFDNIWEKILTRFVVESGISDVKIHLNDNNATPFVVSLRLKQALAEAMEGSTDR